MLLDKVNKLVELSPKAVDGGKEGRIFTLANDPARVAKLHKQFTPRLADKIAYLINNRPEGPSLAWPECLLLDPTDGRPQGFVMPRVIDAYDLSKFTNPLRRPPHVDDRFLLSLACQLAAVVAAVHQRQYVLGDLHPRNTLVTARGVLVLVDLDSVQFTVGGVTYLCEVGRAEFTPREFQHLKGYSSTARTREADLFALAVMLFQLLLGGAHPFSGVFADPTKANRLRDCIRLGLWPYRVPPVPGLSPPPHIPPLDGLRPELQELFRQCFQTAGNGRNFLRAILEALAAYGHR